VSLGAVRYSPELRENLRPEWRGLLDWELPLAREAGSGSMKVRQR
jgi:hypothetical protein